MMSSNANEYSARARLRRFNLLDDDVGWLLTAHFNAHQRDFLIKCLLDHSVYDPGINTPVLTTEYCDNCKKCKILLHILYKHLVLRTFS